MAHDQRVVQDQGQNLPGQDMPDHGEEGAGQAYRADAVAFDEFVIRGPVLAPADGGNHPGYPAFGRDQATAEQFDEGRLGTEGNGLEQEGYPLRETGADKRGVRHEPPDEDQNDPHWPPPCSR